MSRRPRQTLALIATVIVALALAPAPGRATSDAAPRVIGTIALPELHGRIDHLALDEAGGRLFVAALGTDALAVVDLRSRAPLRIIRGLHEPQGALFVPASRQIWVSNGGSGVCDVFDAGTLAPLHSIPLAPDADNLRWDGHDGLVYAGSGGGEIDVIDAAAAAVTGRIPLPAHPESFQLEAAGPRIFVNLPATRAIAVVDRQRRVVVANWPLRDGRANYPMALDEARRRLLVGVRQPPRLDVYDIDTGARVVAVPSVGDMDDLFLDAARGRAYAIGGSGNVDVIATSDGDRYARLARIETRAGARTGAWSPASSQLYVALPRVDAQPAEIRIYTMP